MLSNEQFSQLAEEIAFQIAELELDIVSDPMKLKPVICQILIDELT